MSATTPRVSAPGVPDVPDTPDRQHRTGPPARVVAIVLGLLLPVGYLLWAVGAGLPATSLVTALLAVAVTQVLPGTVLWRALRPRHGSWVEDLTIGFGLGATMAIFAQLLAGYVDVWWLSGAITLGVATVLLAVPGSRRRVLSARTRALPLWWGPLTTLPLVTGYLQTRDYFRADPVTWESGARSLYPDTYLHLALAGQLAHRGPTRFPWVMSEPLGYHYLTHAWIAQVGVTGHVELDVVLLRLLPALIPTAIVLTAAVAAVRLSGRTWAGPVAALLTMAPGTMNLLGFRFTSLPMDPLSPTLGLSAVLLMVLVVLLGIRWRSPTLDRGAPFTWPLVLVLVVATAGTKGSSTPLLVVGAAVALLAALVLNRARARVVALDLVLLVVGLRVSLAVIFRGSDGGLQLSPARAAAQTWAADFLPVSTPGEQAVAAVLTGLGCASVGLLGLMLLVTTPWRSEPISWLLLAGGGSGAAAVMVFAHPGLSQYYFALNAVPLLALGSTLAVVLLHDAIGRARLLALVGIGVVGGSLTVYVVPRVLGPATPRPDLDGSHVTLLVAASLVVLAVTAAVGAAAGGLATPRRRTLAASGAVGLALIAGGAVTDLGGLGAAPVASAPTYPPTAELAATRGQIDAARWIRDHSGVHDVVMTNRHCTTPVDPTYGCDSRRWLVTAYTERQLLVEGWTGVPMSAALTLGEGRESVMVPYWRPALLRLNDGFIEQPTAQAARRLYDMGVRWVFVDHTRPHAATLEPYATLRHRTSDVDVYSLDRP